MVAKTLFILFLLHVCGQCWRQEVNQTNLDRCLVFVREDIVFSSVDHEHDSENPSATAYWHRE